MAAAGYDITIEQGSTFALNATLQDSDADAIDLTGWTFRGNVRSTYSSNTTLAVFDFSITGASTGSLRISMTPTVTAAITVDSATSYRRRPTKYIYDVEGIKPDSTVLRLLEGTCYISPEVTR